MSVSLLHCQLAVSCFLVRPPNQPAMKSPLELGQWMVSLSSRIENVHALSAASHPATLLHAVKLATAGVLRLALHVVIVVVAASGADEERR